MTQLGRFIPADGRPGELGVHSIDHFSLNVPDLAEAEHFYKSFGMDVEAESAKLVLRTASNTHPWGVIAEGSRKCLRYLSFGAFEEDMPRFKARRGAKVQIVPEADEGHSERRKFGQRVDQVFQGPPKAVDLSDHNCVKPSTASVSHQSIECWPRFASA